LGEAGESAPSTFAQRGSEVGIRGRASSRRRQHRGRKQNEEQPPLVAGVEVQDDRTDQQRRTLDAEEHLTLYQLAFFDARCVSLPAIDVSKGPLAPPAYAVRVIRL
jgi:hypothetical protein